MTSLWMSFLGLAAVAAVALFIGALKRWPSICAVSIAGYVSIAWEVPHPPPLVTLAGTSVYYLDILAVAAAVIAAGRLPFLALNLKLGFWPWIGLGVWLVASLFTGLLHNPFGTTVNEFRSFFHPYALMTWAMSLTWNVESAHIIVRRLACTLGWLLTGVAVFHLAVYGFGSASGFVDAGTGLEQTTRPLVSGQALMLLLCSIFCFWYWKRYERRIWMISGLIFLVVVVLSQQRTVWAVGLASMVGVFLVARAGTKGLIILFASVAAWGLAVLLSAQLLPQMIHEISAAATNSGTYDARVRSWANLVTQSFDKGLASVIFGQPMGSGFGRFEGAGRWVEFAPHNWYVTLYLRVGLVGLSTFLAFLIIVVAKLLQERKNMAALAVMTAVIVYGWSYSWPWYLCVFLGWAASQSSRTYADPTAHSSAPDGLKLEQARAGEAGVT